MGLIQLLDQFMSHTKLLKQEGYLQPSLESGEQTKRSIRRGNRSNSTPHSILNVILTISIGLYV